MRASSRKTDRGGKGKRDDKIEDEYSMNGS
jgi:hypothetical protein